MQAGINTFAHLVTNISGQPVSGLTISDFSINGSVGGQTISSGTCVSAAPGYYNFELNVPLGQGFVAITPTNSNNNIAPTFYEIDTSVYTIDDVYASIARQALDTTQISIGSYEAQQIGPYKEGDDIVIDYVVPTSVAEISGFNSFKASLYNKSILTSVTGAGYIGEILLTVSPTSNLVSMLIPVSASSQIIAEGLTEDYFYSDLQAIDSNGYRKTLAEFSILFKRNITR